MAAVGPYRWLAERSAEMIPVRDAELRSSTRTRVHHAEEKDRPVELCLDNAFVLIEGHPPRIARGRSWSQFYPWIDFRATRPFSRDDKAALLRRYELGSERW